jgi:hypothetical protein
MEPDCSPPSRTDHLIFWTIVFACICWSVLAVIGAHCVITKYLAEPEKEAVDLSEEQSFDPAKAIPEAHGYGTGSCREPVEGTELLVIYKWNRNGETFGGCRIVPLTVDMTIRNALEQAWRQTWM